MRYINLDELELPDGWQERAEQLTEQLRQAANDEERAKIIDENPIWRERDLFVALGKLSYNKCWYSEARDIMSDRDIDHFRPKKEAKNVNGIPRISTAGYWWLTYDHENYRFSSEYSNRRRQDKFKDERSVGGKSSYFPLFEHSTVATTKNRCRDEDIILLDPCDPHDPGLINFDSRGNIIPNGSPLLSEKDKIRVHVSVELYHLDHEPLREEREKVWDRCERIINRIRNLTNQPDIGITDEGLIRNLKDELKAIGAKSEELSAVALACCEANGLGAFTEPR